VQEIERNSDEGLRNYLKNIMLENVDELYNSYIELSAREILPITRRLFEENLSLVHEFEISQLIEKEKRLIVYGEAGSGKTSTLKWLNSVFARDCIEGRGEYIPLYVPLDSYVKGSFYDYLKKKVQQKGISESDFEKLLEGKALLLLDGLDMLIPSDGFSPFEEVSGFASDYEDCRYVIASRHGPSGSIKSTFAVCELEKLSDEKAGLFIENYVPNKRQAKLLKIRFLEEINSHHLIRNPLLLQLWIRISIARMKDAGRKELNQKFIPSGGDSTPSGQAELYLTFISELFRHYKIKESSSEDVLSLEITGSEKPDIGRAEIENFLMELAFNLQCRKRISCKYSYALELAEKHAKQNKSGREPCRTEKKEIEARKTKARSLLKTCFELGLLTVNYSEIRFEIGRSFQEYFAALQLKTFFENGADISEACRHSDWENVIIFTSEMVESVESGDELVNCIISSENLDLASKCTGKASPETKEKLCLTLAARLDSRYTAEKVRVIQNLGRMGACGIEASSKVLENRDIGVKREAVRTLGKTKSETALAHLTAALGDEDYSVRIEAIRALSVIGSERAIELLTDALEDRNRAVRLEATNALVKVGSKKALEVLVLALGSKDDFVRFGAIGALGRANPREAADALIKAFQEENKLVRLGAAEALGQMGSERAVEPFLAALQDEDEFIRWMATKALGKIKSDKTSEKFTDILGDKSRYVRREAAKALGVVDSEKALDLLVSALSDEDEFVRKAAAEALGERGAEIADSETAANALVSMLNDESHFVRLEAAKALGMIRFRKAISPLLFVLGDENRFVRKEAAKALGQLEFRRVPTLLIQALESENQFVRQGALRALGQMSSNGSSDHISAKVFDSLDSAFEDEDKLVRREAARTLENISKNMPERAFQSLINALEDEDDEVRRLLAGVLRYLNSEEAIPQLASALKASDPVVRRFAAEALGQTKSEKAIEPLIDTMLFDTTGFVRGEAARSLGKINSRKAIEPLIDALLDESNEGKWGAAEALGRIKAETAVAPLILALADKDDFTRLAAAKALGRIKPKKAIEPLINALYDWNRFVKAEAVGALMNICTKEEKERMQTLLDSENELAANLAFEILEEMKMEELLKARPFSDLPQF